MVSIFTQFACTATENQAGGVLLRQAPGGADSTRLLPLFVISTPSSQEFDFFFKGGLFDGNRSSTCDRYSGNAVFWTSFN
jgi:hypothetical protein